MSDVIHQAHSKHDMIMLDSFGRKPRKGVGLQGYTFILRSVGLKRGRPRKSLRRRGIMGRGMS